MVGLFLPTWHIIFLGRINISTPDLKVFGLPSQIHPLKKQPKSIPVESTEAPEDPISVS
jgi:hypothetical protein